VSVFVLSVPVLATAQTIGEETLVRPSLAAVREGIPYSATTTAQAHGLTPASQPSGGDATGQRRRPYVILTVSMSRGFYLMTDMKDTYDAMADASGFGVHADSFGPGGTWEFGAGLTVRVARQWAVYVGATLMKDDICLKLEDGGWFDAWQCDASVEAGGHTLTAGVVRYLTEHPSEPQPFARVAVGYGWLDLEGYADDLRYEGTAGAPMVEASIGVDLDLWVFAIRFEGGLRFMRFSQHDVDVYAEGTTDMDEELARFLAEGTTDFSGGFIRAGFGVRY